MTEYQKGIELGLQLALDIVNRAADYRALSIDVHLDTTEILARIITDLQTEPVECY